MFIKLDPPAEFCPHHLLQTCHLSKAMMEAAGLAGSILGFPPRNVRAAKLVHWSLGKKCNSKNPWEHQVGKVSENEEVKILWHFQIQKDRHLEHNTPDIAVIEQRNVWSIDISIPGDASVEVKELEE